MPGNWINSTTIFKENGDKVVKIETVINGVPGSWIEFDLEQLEHLMLTLKRRRYEMLHISRSDPVFTCGICMNTWKQSKKSTCVCDPQL
jgi:hypothetical protein